MKHIFMEALLSVSFRSNLLRCSTIIKMYVLTILLGLKIKKPEICLFTIFL